MDIGLQKFVAYEETPNIMGASDPHELICVAWEVQLHPRLRRNGRPRLPLPQGKPLGACTTIGPTYPEKNNDEWFCHVKHQEGRNRPHGAIQAPGGALHCRP